MTTGQLEGLLHIADERKHGQLRDPVHPLRPVKGGISVPRQLIRELNLRPGLLLKGDPRGRMLGKVTAIEGRSPDEYIEKTALYDATALDPEPMLKLEHSPTEVTTRAIDILAPVGFGQRGGAEHAEGAAGVVPGAAALALGHGHPPGDLPR